MTLGVLVVDDEPLARETLVDLVGRAPGVELVGQCGDGIHAARAIGELQPDIVLLDIEMPGLRGTDLAAKLEGGDRPSIIFVTAYGEHATQAFDLRADDYVLKPYSDERLFQAIERAKQRIHERTMAADAATNKQGGLDRIEVRQHRRRLLVPVADLRWLESDDYYVRLHTLDGKSYLIRSSLKLLEEGLDPQEFLRVHRGALVRSSLVTEIRTRATGARQVVLDNGQQVAVSRSRVKAVEARLSVATHR